MRKRKRVVAKWGGMKWGTEKSDTEKVSLQLLCVLPWILPAITTMLHCNVTIMTGSSLRQCQTHSRSRIHTHTHTHTYAMQLSLRECVRMGNRRGWLTGAADGRWRGDRKPWKGWRGEKVDKMRAEVISGERGDPHTQLWSECCGF